MKHLMMLGIVLLGATACAGKRIAVPPPPPVFEHPIERQLLPDTVVPADATSPGAAEAAAKWDAILNMLPPLVASGSYFKADSILGAFSLQNDASCHAAEANYTRAILFLSPSNPRRSASLALPLLDGYLTSTCIAHERAVQVSLLRAMAGDMSAQNVSIDSVSSGELLKLQSQLDSTRKELERLKMRIIPPILPNAE